MRSNDSKELLATTLESPRAPFTDMVKQFGLGPGHDCACLSKYGVQDAISEEGVNQGPARHILLGPGWFWWLSESEYRLLATRKPTGQIMM